MTIKENSVVSTIRCASLSDIDGILSVTNETMLATQKSSDNLYKYGFLTIGLSSEEIKKGILDSEDTIAIVAERNNRINGFTLGYNYKNINAPWKKEINVSKDSQCILMNKRIFYHDYIARSRNAKGIGTQLLKHLIQVAKSQNYEYIMCEIAHEPIVNKVSIHFHEGFGFKYAGTINKSNFTFGIYLLKLSDGTD